MFELKSRGQLDCVRVRVRLEILAGATFLLACEHDEN